MSRGGAEREKENLRRAPRSAWSPRQGFVTQAKINSQTLNQPSHPSTPKTGLSEVSSSSALVSFPSLVQVSEELIRVAILWHEMWHEGLEEASRLYFGERNVKGMFEVLEPLHAMMERGPQTLKETSFNQVWDKKVRHDVTQSRYQTPFPLAFLLT